MRFYEINDPKFTKFMNTSMAVRQDPEPYRADPNTTMGFNNMPGYKHAFDFGIGVIKSLDKKTKKYFAAADDDEFFDYLMDRARAEGRIPKGSHSPKRTPKGAFMEEDLREVVDLFDEVFNDPDIQGWSWADLIRDNLGVPVRALRREQVLAHMQQMQQHEKRSKELKTIDPSRLESVNPTGSSTWEIWYPKGDFYGSTTWVQIEDGFPDEHSAEQRIEQLQKDPDTVDLIKARIADDD